MNKMRLYAVSFIRKSWSKPFNNGIIYNRVGFTCMCGIIYTQNTELFYNFYYQRNWIWKVNGRLHFQKYPTHRSTKKLHREKLCFLTTNFQGRQNSTYWNLVFTIPLRILLKPWKFSFKKDTITAKIVSQFKCLEEHKKLRFTLQMKDLVFHCLVRIVVTFLEEMLAMSWSNVERKRTPQTRFCLRHCPHTLSHNIHGPGWVQNRWRHEGSIAALFSFCFEAQG